MFQICKFCQIIANKETLLYEDETIAIFEDISKQAVEHLIVCPKDHIKSVNKLTKEHVVILEHMKQIANQILLKNKPQVVIIDEEENNKESK